MAHQWDLQENKSMHVISQIGQVDNNQCEYVTTGYEVDNKRYGSEKLRTMLL